jgi:hypothetical protein
MQKKPYCASLSDKWLLDGLAAFFRREKAEKTVYIP